MALQLLPQSTPVSDAAFVQDTNGLKMPVRMSLFSRVWWLFLSELTNAVIALQNNPAGSAARPVRAAGTGAALVLTSTYADVPGATITLGDAGDYPAANRGCPTVVCQKGVVYTNQEAQTTRHAIGAVCATIVNK